MSNRNGTGPTLDDASRAVISSVTDCRTLYRTLKESIRKTDDASEEDVDLTETDDPVRRLRASFLRAKPTIERNLETLEKYGSLESAITIDRTSRSAHVVGFELSKFVEMASGTCLYGAVEMQEALEQQLVIERYLRWVNPGIPTVDAIDWLLRKLTDERKTLSNLWLLARDGGPSTEIIYHGDLLYGTDTADPVTVSDRDHDVLQAFLACDRMDLKKLKRQSGFDSALSVLRRLRTKFECIFAGAIQLPGARRTGGYRVRIRSAHQTAHQTAHK